MGWSVVKAWHKMCIYTMELIVVCRESAGQFEIYCQNKLEHLEVQMKCPKCKGRMYSEKYYDFVRAFDAWKCCACGEVVDPTILANRARNHSVYIG